MTIFLKKFCIFEKPIPWPVFLKNAIHKLAPPSTTEFPDILVIIIVDPLLDLPSETLKEEPAVPPPGYWPLLLNIN